MYKNLSFLDLIKWVVIFFLVGLSVIENYILNDYSSYIKTIIVILTLVIAVCLALFTKVGKLVIIFGKESYFELKKVVWPTYQDSLNTTLIVVAVTVVISLILWGLDTVLVYVISLGLRL